MSEEKGHAACRMQEKLKADEQEYGEASQAPRSCSAPAINRLVLLIGPDSGPLTI